MAAEETWIRFQVEWLCRRATQIRELSGLTQAQVGERMGTSKSHVSNFELCRTEPRIRTFSNYCNALGVDLETLFTGMPNLKGRHRLPTTNEFDRLCRDALGLSAGQTQEVLSAFATTDAGADQLYQLLNLADRHPQYREAAKEWIISCMRTVYRRIL
ncbi:helix-turn-helix domain-containing protein [Aureliella helgolandensis]|uniref:Helix-turn-helix domain protein n=1 Tax=Aureliella helgolandensis TaxID=2527968 RepID=A0A518G857_9BACT|nr:Helix-turn-helix domain protein [Aureliella helgolandensis]